MLYKEELNRIITELKARRKWLDQELKSLPDGFLHIHRRGKKEYYSLRLPKGGNRKKERRKSISGDSNMIYALIRKRYIMKALTIIDKDLSILERASEQYTEFDEYSVMKHFIDEHPDLQKAVFRDPALEKDWAHNYLQAEGLFEKDRTSLASDGTLMRSRGEIVIAEKLRQYNIPFRYEMEQIHPNIPYTPDFVIRRPRDGKIFYWEHFGDVNDQDYMRNNARKLEVYEEYGIVPWDNLIITYDTIDGGVNTPLIEAMIHAWLL